MKKTIFGCALMISGVIGSVGWLIAHALLVQAGAWSSLLNILNRVDGIVVLLFMIVAVIGGVMAGISLREKEA